MSNHHLIVIELGNTKSKVEINVETKILEPLQLFK